jgi:hypothetical protein
MCYGKIPDYDYDIQKPEEEISDLERAIENERQISDLKQKFGILNNMKEGNLEGEWLDDETAAGKENQNETTESTNTFTHEQYLADLHPSILETYKKWSYDEEQLKTVEQVTANPDNIHIDEEIPFDAMVENNNDSTKREANKSQTGEIYLNSESIDFETATTFIPEIPDDIQKQGVSGVMKYIHETFGKGAIVDGKEYILPDIKYYQYLAELGDQYKKETDETKKESLLKQIPEQLRDGNYCYFPGSALVFRSGSWVSPNLVWRADGFYRYASRVEDGWHSRERVVLLER